MITLSKGKSKYLRSLRRRKIRHQVKSFVLEGEKMCLELIKRHPDQIEFILIAESLIKTLDIDTVFLSEKLILGTTEDFKEHTAMDHNPGILMVAKMPDWDFTKTDKGKWIYLDGIQDPGNLGTIFRTAAWFGIEGIIIGPGSVDPYNPKVIQSSMGGLFQVQHHYLSLEAAKEKLVDWPIMGLDMQGANIQTVQMPERGVLVLGAEGKGVSEEVRNVVKNWWHIPKGNNAKMESLNAGVAVAIAIDRWTQQS